MATYVALLRAVNVTGNAILPMAELRTLCVATGFTDVRTYIQSGNVVFRTRRTAASAKAALEEALRAHMERDVRVLIRTADELDALLAANPFPAAPPNRVIVFLLDRAPPSDAIRGWPVPGGERLALHGRELFVHYPDGQGKSRLKVPFADLGTGRNLNTLRAVLAIARGEA